MGTWLLFILLSFQVFAGVLKKDSVDIQHARIQRFISSQILVVKIKSRSAFKDRYAYLGEFTSFYKNRSGEWGYFNLNMLPDAKNAEAVLQDLSVIPDVIHAYFAPLPKNSDYISDLSERVMPKKTSVFDTPDFSQRQFHLDKAPRGIGATQVKDLPGASGKNVKIIDIETCFQADHEDFHPAFYIGQNPECAQNDHGTAVWGILAAKDDGRGVTGIVPEAEIGIHGFLEGLQNDVDEKYLKSMDEAIQGALKHLSYGDVLLLEQQMVGPDYRRYTVVEYWPHIFEQLKDVTDRGIHCVEAAGNSNSDLDSVAYHGAFDLKKKDSGCVIVGALGNNFSREKWNYSNFGSRVDAAGYGEGVVTTGYGDLFYSNEQRKYTARFGGTSSASPIVAGAIALISSVAIEQSLEITPKEMREALRRTGSSQGPQTQSQRVGNLPNVVELLNYFKLSQNESYL